MNRLANVHEPIRMEHAILLFQRTMANWATDLLRRKPRPHWPPKDPDADHRDRNWKSLYSGSVLDD